MRNTVKILVSVFLAVALLMVACAGTAGKFEDTTWVLESYGPPANPKTVIQGIEVTATFNSADARVTGKAGCNNYFGSYEVKGSKVIGRIHDIID
jgi:heat shock protein HslJ